VKDAMPGGLELSVTSREANSSRFAVVRAEGEIDLSNAEDLAGALGSSRCTDSDGVVLDLVGVPFMDSSGLRAVLVAANELRPTLAVVISPGSPVLRLLELAEVSDRLPAYATEDEAIAALVNGKPGPA
jgi:stage II sporulation protein AA (anti-sigma F factor antagonist)